MSPETANAADIEIARVLHAALGMFLTNNGAAPKTDADDLLLYSPEDAARRLGLDSTNQLYRRTADGTWPYTPVGGRKKFSAANLEQIVKIQELDAVKKSNRKSALT